MPKKPNLKSAVLTAMNKTNEAPKVVEDFVVDETTEVVRENFITSSKLPSSLWEKNLKCVNTQIDQWISFQQDYMDLVVEIFDKFLDWNVNPKNTHNTLKYPLALQNNYIDAVRITLNDFTKNYLNFIQKNIETASSLLNSYFNQFKVNK